MGLFQLRRARGIRFAIPVVRQAEEEAPARGVPAFTGAGRRSPTLRALARRAWDSAPAVGALLALATASLVAAVVMVR